MDRPREPDLAFRLFGASPERALALMRCAWPAAVGPELARRTEVVAFDGGLLRVRVPDAAWQKSLWRMRGDILARLRAIAGRAAPRSLGFVQGPVAEPPLPPPAPAAPSPRLPPSLVEAAAVIEDEALRETFLAAAGRYLGRFSPSPGGSPAAGAASGGAAGASLAAGGSEANSATASSAGTGTGRASGR
jgi:hypothetical protein